MRKNKKLILISSILATTAMVAVPAISIVNNINTVSDSQLNNAVQNNQQVEVDSIDSNINTVEDNLQAKNTEATFKVDAKELMAEGWSTSITGDLIFTILNDAGKTVSVKAEDPALFTATDLIIQGNISNAGLKYTITDIAEGAFSGCKGLTGVLLIDETVVTVDDRAFEGCSGLNGLNLTGARDLETINNSAFENCSGLDSIYIPGSVTTIEPVAFNGCKFTSIGIAADNTAFAKATNLGTECDAILRKGTPTKFDFAQPARDQIIGGLLCGQLELPSDLTSIVDSAFQDCSGLTGTLTIPASVTTISTSAFRNCFGLKNLDLSNATSLETVGMSAFLDCSGLTNLTIPASVTSIETRAFNGCNFSSIDVDSNNTKFSKAENLGPCQAIIDNTSAVFSANSKVVGSLAYGDIVLPTDIKTIGEQAFSSCSGLTGTLTIPASVTSIGDNAFSGCSNLAGTLTIPASVTSIGEYAFLSCVGLTDATIGSGVTAIGDMAFALTKLLNINVLNETPPTILPNTFQGTYDTCVLHILPGTKASYTANSNWNQFKNIIDDYIPPAPANDSNLGAIIGGTLGGLAGAAAIAGGTTYGIKRNKKAKKNKMGGVPPTSDTPSGVSPTTNTPSGVTATTNTPSGVTATTDVPSFEQK